VVVAVVIALTVVAAVLRLYKLGEWSFWVDEMFTLRDSVGRGWRFHGGTFPLSYMLTAVVVKLFGLNEWTARLTPAVFGILTPAMVYLLGRRAFGDVSAAIAAMFVAVSPWHLYWSQMARFYSMTLFFSAASVLALHRAFEDDSRRWAAAAGLLLALGTLSHYSALLLMPGIGLYVLLVLVLRWPRPNGLNWANVLIFLAPFLLGAVAVGMRAGRLIATYVNGHPTGTHIADPLKGGAYMIASLSYRMELALVAMALVAVGIGLARRNRGVLLLATTTAAAVGMLVFFGMMSHAENRYGFVIFGNVAILAALTTGMVTSKVWESNRLVAIAVPIALALPMLQHDVSYFSRVSMGERWNYKGAAQYLREHGRRGETVYSSMPLSLDYYLTSSGLVVRDLNPDTRVTDVAGRRIWFVMEDSTRGESASRELGDWMKSNCRLEANFAATSPAADYGVSVYSFEKR
jgi:hypothetical protein